MKLSVNQEQLIELEDVFNPVVIKNGNFKISVAARDGGFEITDDKGKTLFFHPVDGVRELNKVNSVLPMEIEKDGVLVEKVSVDSMENKIDLYKEGEKRIVYERMTIHHEYTNGEGVNVEYKATNIEFVKNWDDNPIISENGKA